ncbi:chemotaxis protein CheA [Ancylobacter rudongensis]|uniref:Chemotaxis protein CheA n=1 Tax=Ancylobacter rudongensis TaxID=177413 RepID=A0A1G4SEY0_9HYPH|nr:chemotaxis protein CheA [Ancylobacter rudongensis]SCW67764.1 two-component system, chemotaxis family, sensor kinase CheA [Ancylobacter rudongensis]
MNEFIEQFLIEARELVEQGTADLLAAEERPRDAAAIDGAFRAFHTLKGSAGIIDFAAMARALHAAEDALSQVRAGAVPITGALIGQCLTCLDQVVHWLDAIEATGEPPDAAERDADAVIALFGAAEAAAPPAATGPAALDAWLATLPAAEPAGGARCAFAYTPAEDAFFRGEDPLATVQALPGLLALDLVLDGATVDPAEIDPFHCRLTLFILCSEPRARLELAFAGLSGTVDWRDLAPPAAPGAGTPVAAGQLIAAQIALLRGPEDEGSAGRRASALRAALQVLRASGRDVEAAALERLADAGATPQRLADALDEARADTHAAPSPFVPGTEPVIADVGARSLRVDVERIDALVRLTGEFTVLKTQAAHHARLAAETTSTGEARELAAKELATQLKSHHETLERLVGALQHAVLGIRVLPLRHVFQRLPRLVRDMSDALGKPIRLVIEGEETEADKAIVEALFEPLLHILRNAADHGIEPAGARAAAGKPETGIVAVRARRVEDRLTIEVEDDGAGIDTARLRARAGERGLASPAVLAAMSEEEALDLIFAPGFSTRDEVTGYSGRGVGMDAVRVALARLGGRVRVHSRPGEGTRLALSLPVSVMKTDVLSVESGGQVLGIPLEAVVETARLPRSAISRIGAASVFVWRERTLPLIDLAQAMGLAPAPAGGGDARIVITRLNGELGGLEVERLGARMEVMLRPLEGLLAGLPCHGTTLLGDGRVLIVLDLEALQP